LAAKFCTADFIELTGLKKAWLALVLADCRRSLSFSAAAVAAVAVDRTEEERCGAGAAEATGLEMGTDALAAAEGVLGSTGAGLLVEFAEPDVPINGRKCRILSSLLNLFFIYFMFYIFIFYYFRRLASSLQVSPAATTSDLASPMCG